MKLVAMILMILANSALFSLGEVPQGTSMYYALVSTIVLFFIFCMVTIVKQDEKIKYLEKRA